MRDNLPLWLRVSLGFGLFLLVSLALALETLEGASALNVHPDNRRVLQLFVGANLLALGVSVFATRSFCPENVRWFLSIPAIGVAIIDGLLAGTLILEFRADRLWLLALFVPAISLGSVWFVAQIAQTASEADMSDDSCESADFMDGDEDNQPLVTPKRILASEAVTLIWSILSIVTILVGLIVGTIIFILLKGVLFNDQSLPLYSLGWLFKADLWFEIGLYIVVIPAVFITFYGIIALGRAILLRLSMKDRRRYYRHISKQEIDYVDNAVTTLSEYSESQIYPRYWGILYFSLGIGMLGVFLLVSFAGYSSGIVNVRGMTVFRDLGSFLIPQTSITPSMLLGIFSASILIWPTMQWLYRAFPRWVEFIYLREGWNSMSSEPRSEVQFYIELDADLRNDRINDRSKFDPAQYIQMAYRRIDRVAIHTAWLTICVLVIVFTLDVQSYKVLTRDEMIRSGYFSFEQVRYRYEDAVGLQTGCYIGSRDDQPALILRYRIIAPDGVGFDLDDLLKADTLADIERIDDIVRQVDAPHADVERKGIRNRDKPGLDPQCLPELERIHGEDAVRIQTLLRLSSPDTN